MPSPLCSSSSGGRPPSAAGESPPARGRSRTRTCPLPRPTPEELPDAHHPLILRRGGADARRPHGSPGARRRVGRARRSHGGGDLRADRPARRGPAGGDSAGHRLRRPLGGLSMEPYELSLSPAADEIAARRLSPVELTESVLDRIEATEPALGAFACVTADQARKAAAQAEQEIAAGRYLGPLHGIPLGVKDLYDTAGVPATSSSKVRADHVPDTDAVAVERLLAAGMVMVGKTHTHEFAYGGITPTTRNPWDTGRIPGGSSGGSGAAVAAGACMVGLGSDTAGSIRIPSSLCGTVGLKPTYGRASRRGVASLSWSLDHVGPLTRNVRDCALVLNAIAGFDRLDPATVDVPVPDYTTALGEGIAGLRVGVPTNYFFDHVHEDVAAAVRTALGVLEGLGAELREVAIPYADQILAAEWGILLPEASAYHQEMLRSSGDLYTDDVRLFLEVGELVLATDYIKALRVRTLMQQ